MLSLGSFEKQVIFLISDYCYLVYVFSGQVLFKVKNILSIDFFWYILLLKIFLSGKKVRVRPARNKLQQGG